MAVFLDRDGVLNRKIEDGYVTSWDLFVWLPGAREAIAGLTSAGERVVVVSNQAGVGKGLMTEADLAAIHERMLAEGEEAGGRIAAIYYCPHHPEAGCECRKPKPGLLLRAAREQGITLAGSYFVGDDERDVLAGRAAGCKTILVGASQSGATPAALPDYHAVDLRGAAALILTLQGKLAPSEEVRLDAWLRVARVFKTRSQAATACHEGRVTVNGDPAKAHHPVRIGDRIVVRLEGRKRVVEVLALASRPLPPPKARALYFEQAPPPGAGPRSRPAGGRPRGAGRPTKRDRRRIEKLRWD